MILSAFGATIVVFALSRAAGDPLLLYAKPGGYGITEEARAALSKKLGLDHNVVVQYFIWAGQTLRGDLGRSLIDESLVTKIIGEKIGGSLQLGFAGWVFATLLGVPLGIISAVRRGSIWDYLGRGIAIMGQGVPAFWIGIMMVLLFAVALDWLPTGTRGRYEGFPLAWGNVKYFVLPTISLGWFAAATYLRITRSAMLEVLDSEYLVLARAKGVSSRAVIWKHAFRNALIPTLTVSSLVMAGLITGSVVTEAVFAWPGMGRLAVQAVIDNDFPILSAAVLFWVGIFVGVNFITDLLYAVVDPRIRYS